jgi:hypothetical protein
MHALGEHWGDGLSQADSWRQAARLASAAGGPAVRGCLDWTEGAPHLAGRLGSALLAALLAHRWLLRRPRDRALTITGPGREQLRRLGIEIAGPPAA